MPPFPARRARTGYRILDAAYRPSPWRSGRGAMERWAKWMAALPGKEEEQGGAVAAAVQMLDFGPVCQELHGEAPQSLPPMLGSRFRQPARLHKTPPSTWRESLISREEPADPARSGVLECRLRCLRAAPCQHHFSHRIYWYAHNPEDPTGQLVD